MKKMSKIIGVLLSLVMLFSAAGVNAGAEEIEKANNVMPLFAESATIHVLTYDNLDHMGYCPASEVTTNTETLRSIYPNHDFTINQGEEYIFYNIQGKTGNWWINTYDDCVSLKLEGNELIVRGASFDYFGVTYNPVCNYKVNCIVSPCEPDKAFFNIVYSKNAQTTEKPSPIFMTMKLNTPYAVTTSGRVDATANQVGYLPKPLIVNNKTFLPLRFMCEALGLVVSYDETTGNTKVSSNDTGESITFVTGSTEMQRKGYCVKTITDAPAPALLINGSTHVPVRSMLEAFGYWVDWEDAGYIIVSHSDATAHIESYIEAFERG